MRFDENPFRCQWEKGSRVSNLTRLLVVFGLHHGSEGVNSCFFFFSAGNCTYQSLVGVTMTQYPDASSGSITDVSTCWSLCLQLLLNGKECMAAVLESSTAVCKLYVGTELLNESAIQTASSAGSTVMLRRCFECMYSNNNDNNNNNNNNNVIIMMMIIIIIINVFLIRRIPLRLYKCESQIMKHYNNTEPNLRKH